MKVFVLFDIDYSYVGVFATRSALMDDVSRLMTKDPSLQFDSFGIVEAEVKE